MEVVLRGCGNSGSLGGKEGGLPFKYPLPQRYHCTLRLTKSKPFTKWVSPRKVGYNAN